ncbi:MAG: SCP-like extracellular [Caulobacteraceae bacterium]|nr:SCP-like extracellular [Caulobacteraceae bacterium]
MDKRSWLAGAAVACSSVLLGHSARAATIGDGILAELNFARTRPAEYARVLEREVASARSAASGFADEDPYALEEAVDFLRSQQPLPPLRSNPGLVAAAVDHAQAQGQTGGFGHLGPDGAPLSERLHRHGVWAGLAAEDISYGYRTPRDVVRQLIVDSGVPNRGHRNNIFGPAYQLAGVGCGRHSQYGAMCVIDFAGAMVRR